MFKNTTFALSLMAGGCASFNEDPLDHINEVSRTAVLSARQDHIVNANETVKPYIGAKAPLHCLTNKTCEWDEVKVGGREYRKTSYDQWTQPRLVTLDCETGEARFSRASHHDEGSFSTFTLARRTDLNFDVGVHAAATGRIDISALERAAIDDVPLALQMAEAWCPNNFGTGAIEYVTPEERWDVSGLSLTFLTIMTLATAMTTASAITNLRRSQMRDHFHPSRLITTILHDQLSVGLFTGFAFSVGAIPPTLEALRELYAAGDSYASLAHIALLHSFALTGFLTYFMERADKVFVEGTLENFPAEATLDTLKIVAERLKAENNADKYPRSPKNLVWMSTTKQKFMRLQHSGSLDTETMAVVTIITTVLDQMIRRAQDKTREERTQQARERGW